MKVIDLKIGGAVEAPPYLIGIKNEFIVVAYVIMLYYIKLLAIMQGLF